MAAHDIQSSLSGSEKRAPEFDAPERSRDIRAVVWRGLKP